MLVSFVVLFFWSLFSVVFSLYSSLSISVFILCFFFFVFSGYSGLFCTSFVSLYGSLDILGVLLVSLSVWVSVLMLLVRVKYFFGGFSPFYFSFSVGSLMLVVVVFFFTDNLLVFYVMFEFSLIPTLYLILKWGYQPERLQAGLYFFMYTVCGSLPLLFSIVLLQFCGFSSYICFLYPFCFLDCLGVSYLFFLSLVFGFLVKVPM